MITFPNALSAAQSRVKTDAMGLRALDSLRTEANAILQKRIPSVMDKVLVPASGNKHDYMSLGRYWWPNPATESGLPYIRRDGEANPEGAALDVENIRFVFISVRVLAFAWALTGEERYAAHAVEMLRAWFLHPETAMTPHLEYAQAIPGICEGRDIGIIDSALVCPRLLDGLKILEAYPGWADEERQNIRLWLEQFFEWLRTSENARGESNQKNNHGTWFDVQFMAMALYLGETELARDTAEIVKARIASQIEPDGSQPHELARTLSQGYAAMNLEGFMLLAHMAQQTGVDLWHFETADGRSIRQAVEWLLPFATEEQEWPYEQIKPFNRAQHAPIFRRAAAVYEDERFASVLTLLDETAPAAVETWLMIPVSNMDRETSS